MDSKISEAVYSTRHTTFAVKIVKVLAEIINNSKSSYPCQDQGAKTESHGMHHQLISNRQIHLSPLIVINSTNSSNSTCSHRSLGAQYQGTSLSKNQLKHPYRYRKCKCCARYHLRQIYVSLIKRSLSMNKKTTNLLQLSSMENS